MRSSWRLGRQPSVTIFLIFVAFLISLLSPIVFKSAEHARNPHYRQRPFPYLEKEGDIKVGTPFALHEDTYNSTITDLSSPFTRRAIEYEAYHRLVCKGRDLLNMIRHKEHSTDRWAPSALNNGWRRQPNVLAAVPEDLKSTVRRLGIPTEGDAVRSVYLYQDQTFMDSTGHRNTPPTGGKYLNTFIPSGNTIIAESNYSPKFTAPGAKVPPLWRWSDIVWLLWTQEAGTNARNLKYIFRNNVNTRTTRELMEYIEVKDPDRLNLPWPGKAYDMSTEEGLALLATSHGQGVAYLVIDHSDVLGRKIPLARMFTVRPGEVSDSETSGSTPGSESASDDSEDEDESYYYILWELRNTITG